MESDDRNTDFVLTEELRDELDRRLADFEADPLAGESWEKVKARLLKRPDSSPDF